MKRAIPLFLIPAFLLGTVVHAQDQRDNNKEKPARAPAQVSTRQPARARVSRPAQVRQPVVIQMNRQNYGSNNHPAQQPSYGQSQRSRTAQPRQRSAPQAQPVRQANSAQAPAPRVANAVRHHAYTPGYVRKKLTTIGVKTEPGYITNRSEIVSVDRAHSVVGNPRTGPHGEAFKASAISPRKFNSNVVRNQMAIVDRPAYRQQIERENINETERDHVYWHGAKGVDYSYAHYIDHSGYHWYGWYTNDQFFWTRNYNGRWWWYDSGYNRWCFYNDNYWWWQDPYHVGELYVYNDEIYIPANSADDSVVVNGTEQANELVYNSPDGSRRVKLVQSDGDAFLYDTANPPTFDPIYLASGVQTVQFSDVNNGRPLEIMLKLNDGSYDMFDGEGHPYNSGN